MANNLCIDWGNSQVKAAIFDEKDNIVHKQQFSALEADHVIDNLIETYQPAGGILCSVADYPSALEDTLRARIGKLIVLDNNTPLPVMNAYHTPETLGMDRLALVVGANARFPDKNNLVICLGTCITYNLVQKTKIFRGGSISPGLHMRLQSMHEHTDRLPLVPVEGELLLLGYDTHTSMRSGAIFGMAAEIDGMIRLYSAQYPDFNAVLTGGDAALFEDKLKSVIFADPELSLKGLNLILKYNVPVLR